MALAIEPDGKIVAVGNEVHYWPAYHPYANYDSVTLARDDADGFPDPTFGDGGTTTPGTSPQGNDALAVVFAPDGTFLVAGAASTSSGQTPSFLAARFRGLDLTEQAPVVGDPGQPLSERDDDLCFGAAGHAHRRRPGLVLRPGVDRPDPRPGGR